MTQRSIDILLRLQDSQFGGRLAANARATEDFGRRTESSMQRAGQSMTNAGSALAPLSAALAVGGAAAIHMGNNYELSFAKIEGLVGVARSEVEAMKASTLQLAGATAQAPAELADAMFTIQSAGIRGAAGTDALRIAAELAAGGMGSTRDVAQALTGVLNAYRSTGISAAEAGDFLAATARAGNFEVSQLSGAIGRVLPIASSAGVALSDVGGSIALLTRNGLSASEAVTQTNAVLRGMVAPSGEAQTAIEGAGLSFDEVRRVLQEDGLVAAINLLEEASGGSQETFIRMVGGSEAAAAAFTVLNADAEALEGTFGTVSDSAGVAGEVFSAVADTDAFAYQQAMQEVKAAVTEFGLAAAEIGVPIVKALGGAASDAAGFFREMPGPMRTTIIAIAGVGAVASPTLIALGKLTGAVETLTGKDMAKWARANKLALGGIGLAAVAAGLAYKGWHDEQRAARERAEKLTEALRQMGDPLVTAVDHFGDLVAKLREVDEAGDGAEQSLSVLGTDVLSGLLRSDEVADAFHRMNLSLDEVNQIASTGTDVFGDLQDRWSNLITEEDRLGNKTHSVAAALELLGEYAADIADPAARQLAETFIEQAKAGEITTDQMYDLLNAVDETADAWDDHRESLGETAEDALRDAVEIGKLTQAQVDAAVAASEASTEAGRYTDALVALTPELEEAAAAADSEAHMEHSRALQAAGLAGVDAADGVEEFAGALDEETDSAEEAKEAAERLAAQHEALADVFSEVSDALSDLNRMLDASQGAQQDYDSAVLATVQAQQDLNDVLAESADDNIPRYTAGLDLTTKRGQEVLTTARDVAESIRDEAIAMVAAGGSAEEAAGKHALMVAGLQQTLREAGFTQAEIDDLIGTYASVPDDVLTVLEAETGDAQDKVDALIDMLLNEYGVLSVEAMLEADPEGAIAAAREAGLVLTEMADGSYVASLAADSSPAVAEAQAVASHFLALTGSPHVATVAAQTDAGSLATTGAELDSTVTNQGQHRLGIAYSMYDRPSGNIVSGELDTVARARTSPVYANADWVQANINIDYAARTRYTTIHVRTVGGGGGESGRSIGFGELAKEAGELDQQLRLVEATSIDMSVALERVGSPLEAVLRLTDGLVDSTGALVDIGFANADMFGTVNTAASNANTTFDVMHSGLGQLWTQADKVRHINDMMALAIQHNSDDSNQAIELTLDQYKLLAQAALDAGLSADDAFQMIVDASGDVDQVLIDMKFHAGALATALGDRNLAAAFVDAMDDVVHAAGLADDAIRRTMASIGAVTGPDGDKYRSKLAVQNQVDRIRELVAEGEEFTGNTTEARQNREEIIRLAELMQRYVIDYAASGVSDQAALAEQQQVMTRFIDLAGQTGMDYEQIRNFASTFLAVPEAQLLAIASAGRDQATAGNPLVAGIDAAVAAAMADADLSFALRPAGVSLDPFKTDPVDVFGDFGVDLGQYGIESGSLLDGPYLEPQIADYWHMSTTFAGTGTSGSSLIAGDFNVNYPPSTPTETSVTDALVTAAFHLNGATI